MANEILVKQGTAVCWADTTDYSATGNDGGVSGAAGSYMLQTHSCQKV